MCGEPDVTPVVRAGGSALVGGLERERDCELRLVEVPGVVPPARGVQRWARWLPRYAEA